MIEKMKFINLIGYIKDIDRVIEKYISKFDIQLECAIDKFDNRNVKCLNFAESYSDLSKKAERILSLNNNKQDSELVISRDDAVKIISDRDRIENQIQNKRVNDLQNEINSLKNLICDLNHFRNFDFDFSKLNKFRFINYKFGFMPVNNYRQYEAFLYDEKDILMVKGETEENYVWCAYFTYNSAVKRVDDIFSSFNFEQITIPFEINQFKLSGSMTRILAGLRNKLFSLNNELKDMKSETDIIINDKEVMAAKKILQMRDEHETKKFCAVVCNDFFIFTGWLAQGTFDLLDNEVKNDNLVMLVADEKSKDSPPVLLSNNFLFKPFEFLVKMYGLPSYYEIDPTPFFAITYTVLFGLMFGDVGQGLVLLLSGIFFSMKKKKPMFQIISTLGLSSMFFGILYGSVFGFEELIPAIWIKPSDNITFVLFFSVVAGIFLLLTSMVFNLINCFRINDFADMFLGPNGISGFIFYVCVIFVCAFVFMKKGLFWVYLFLTVAAINLLLIAFSGPLKNFLSGERKIFGPNIFLFLFETIIKLFETLLSYFTNTVSFVRVGAFALSHAGMMSVVMLLSKSESDFCNWFVVILGNIIVILLEGLIVGIQVLRLEFYEMFGRFFRGNGREYVVGRKKIN